mgnify:CR=1 FL=1|jgi:hypothetical protein
MDLLTLCRDAAWDAIKTEAEKLRPAYEAEVHRNNAILKGGCIKITRDINAGEEILLTKGFEYYQK